MKGAYLITSHPSFLQAAWTEMSTWPHLVEGHEGGAIRLTVDGLGTALLEEVPARLDFDWRPVLPTSMQDRADLSAVSVSCHSEKLFCCLARALKHRLGIELWVVDGGDNLLDAGSVSPETIEL